MPRSRPGFSAGVALAATAGGGCRQSQGNGPVPHKNPPPRRHMPDHAREVRGNNRENRPFREGEGHSAPVSTPTRGPPRVHSPAAG